MRVVEASRHRSSCCHASWRIAIDWGVYGVPEAFVVDADGRIVYRHVGPLMPRDVDDTIRPILEELRG